MLLLVKNLLFTLIAPGTVAVVLPFLITRGRMASTGVAFAISLVLCGIGGAIYAWCVWDFATFGRGTLAPIDAPKRLVVRGLYRYVRNPMYIGVLTVVLAWAVVFQSASIVLYAVGVAVMFNLFILLYEEPHLRRSFGAEYDDYCTRVNRWLPSRPRSSESDSPTAAMPGRPDLDPVNEKERADGPVQPPDRQPVRRGGITNSPNPPDLDSPPPAS